MFFSLIKKNVVNKERYMDIYLDRDLYCEHFEVCILSREAQVSTCPSAHTSIRRVSTSLLVSVGVPWSVHISNDEYLICVTPEKTREGNDSSDALWNGTIT